MNPILMTYMTDAGQYDRHNDRHGDHRDDARGDSRREGRGKSSGEGRGSGRRGRRGRPGGPPPWAASGRGAPFGAYEFAPRGPRSRAGRGNVRAAVLLLLAEQPRHGYEIITEVVERSEGRWQPSPGSVYPVLKRLAGEGLVYAKADGDRRVFELTDAGRAYVDENVDALGEPWAEVAAEAAPTADLLDAMRQVAMALTQVAHTGDEKQVAAATALMRATKRSLYLMLAGDGEDAAQAEDRTQADEQAPTEDRTQADDRAPTEDRAEDA